MRLTPLLLLSWSVNVLAALINPIEKVQDATILDSGSLDVPGKNSLVYCRNPVDDILHIEYVDLYPNPPQAGQSLIITAKGTLVEPIEQGSKIRLQVKYGLITLIKQEADLCDNVKNVDLDCPIEKGETTLTKVVEIPSHIPPGKYEVMADVFTEYGRRITCLRTHIEFSTF